MKRYTPEELAIVIQDHKKWMMDKSGSRANLSGANLSRADLSMANLYGVDLSRADLSMANISRANLSMANISRANLSGADLSMANLYGADLSGANLYGANLYGANLYGADLSRADLSMANLYGANLYGADLSGVKIRIAAAFNGVYKYVAMPVIAEDGTEYIRLGCHFRKASEWAENFWNNPNEFPNNGDIASKDRWNAYQTCLRWLEDHRDTK